jgi:hypothetical protein
MIIVTAESKGNTTRFIIVTAKNKDTWLVQ